jgi:FkbM family methyltransferase
MPSLSRQITALGLRDIRGQALQQLEEYGRRGIPIVLYGDRLYARMIRTLLADHEVTITDTFADGDPRLKDYAAIRAAYDRFVVVFGCVMEPTARAARHAALVCPNLCASFYLELPFPIDQQWLTTDVLNQRMPDYTALAAELADERSTETLIELLGAKLTGDTSRLAGVATPASYFTSELVRCDDESVLVDCGAYTGDTLAATLRHGVPFKEYHAIEPDAQNFGALSRVAADHVGRRVLVHQLGVLDRSAALAFAAGHDASSMIADHGPTTIAVDQIDRLVPSATFIKMDIEGAEYPALVGASETIRRRKPTLAICVYHRIDDLVRIPALLRQLRPDYRFHLRQHCSWSTRELVLYAT